MRVILCVCAQARKSLWVLKFVCASACAFLWHAHNKQRESDSGRVTEGGRMGRREARRKEGVGGNGGREKEIKGGREVERQGEREGGKEHEQGQKRARVYERECVGSVCL